MIINTPIFGSGGGVDINIVAYASSFPASAAANTIGVITANAITGYFVSADEPTGGAEGNVWIKTGSESNTPIPISGDGNVLIYPIAGYQYLSGAWVKIDSDNIKCYQSGWKPWRKYITNGGSFEGNTFQRQGSGGSWAIDGDHVRCVNTSRVVCNQVINTTGYTKLVIDYNVTEILNSNESQRSVGLDYVGDVATSTISKYVALVRSTGAHTVTLDLTDVTDGNYYFKLVVSTSGSMNVYSIYLEG